MVGYVVAVDLGTTFSAAAVTRPGRVEVLGLGTRSTVIPSMVSIRPDGGLLTGEAAERRSVLEPLRSAREFKRRLGDPTPLLLGGVPYGAEALTGHLLRAVVERVADEMGGPPDLVALTHPANYGPYKLGLLAEAAHLAGVGVPVLVPEPVAAAVHYASLERVEPGELMAVYDFGGGTFDVAVVETTGDGFVVRGTPAGMDRFGGIDLDEAVFGHVRAVIGAALDGLDAEDPAARSALARLRDECRQGKEALSGDTEVEIPVILPNLNTQVRLTRSEFEDMIRPRVRETIEMLGRVVASAGVGFEDLARVLLVGGSSRIPLVAEMVGRATGCRVAVDTNPKHAVVLGAARVAQARREAGDVPDVPPVSPATDRPGPVEIAPGVEAVGEPAPDASDEVPSELGFRAVPQVGDDAGSRETGDSATQLPGGERRHRRRVSWRAIFISATVVAVSVGTVIATLTGGDGGSSETTAAASSTGAPGEVSPIGESSTTSGTPNTSTTVGEVGGTTAAVVTYPVSIKVTTSSNWMNLYLPTEADWIVETTRPEFDGTWSWDWSRADAVRYQPAQVSVLGSLEAAQVGESYTVDLDMAMTPIGSLPEELRLEIEGGCIGNVDLVVYNRLGPAPRQVLATSVVPCDGGLARQPVYLSTADLTAEPAEAGDAGHPVRISVTSSSDWGEVLLSNQAWWSEPTLVVFDGAGGASWDWAWPSPDGNPFDRAQITVLQSLGGAEAGTAVNLVLDVEMLLDDPVPDNLRLAVDGGCIGTIDLEVFDLDGGATTSIGQWSFEPCSEPQFVLLPIDDLSS